MWKYTETDAYDSISLHDCITNDIKIVGNDLIINFSDGFWITPISKHIDHDKPLKTGPSQLRFIGSGTEDIIDSVYFFKPTFLLGKEIFCRRIAIEVPKFLKMINDGTHELEFLTEYHTPCSVLYKCCIRCASIECEFEITAKSIEYSWNEIDYDREW